MINSMLCMLFTHECRQTTIVGSITISGLQMLVYYSLTCSAIWGLLDKDHDLRASDELLNTERTL